MIDNIIQSEVPAPVGPTGFMLAEQQTGGVTVVICSLFLKELLKDLL